MESSGLCTGLTKVNWLDFHANGCFTVQLRQDMGKIRVWNVTLALPERKCGCLPAFCKATETKGVAAAHAKHIVLQMLSITIR